MTDSPLAPAGYYFAMERFTDQGLRLGECRRRRATVQAVLEIDAKLLRTAAAPRSNTSVRRGLLFLAMQCPEELVPCWQSKGNGGEGLKVADMVKELQAFVKDDENIALVKSMGLPCAPQKTGYYPKYIQQLLQRDPSGRRDGGKSDGRAGPVAVVALRALYGFDRSELVHLAPLVRAFGAYIDESSTNGAATPDLTPYLARLDDVSYAVVSSMKADLRRWLRNHRDRATLPSLERWLAEIESGCGALTHPKAAVTNRAIGELVEDLAFCVYVVSGYSRDDPRSTKVEGDLEQAMRRTRHAFFTRETAPDDSRTVPAPPLSVVRALLASVDHTIYSLIDLYRAAPVAPAGDLPGTVDEFCTRAYSLANNLLNLRAALDTLPPLVEDWPMLRKSMGDVHRPIA